MTERSVSIRLDVEGGDKAERTFRAVDKAAAGAAKSVDGVLSGFMKLGQVAETIVDSFTSLRDRAREAEVASQRLGLALRGTSNASGLTRRDFDLIIADTAAATPARVDELQNAAARVVRSAAVGDEARALLRLSADASVLSGRAPAEEAERLARVFDRPSDAASVDDLLPLESRQEIEALAARDVQAARTLFIDALSRQIGGAGAAALSSLGGPSIQLKKSFDNLMVQGARPIVEFGDAVSDSTRQVVDAFARTLTPKDPIAALEDEEDRIAAELLRLPNGGVDNPRREELLQQFDGKTEVLRQRRNALNAEREQADAALARARSRPAASIGPQEPLDFGPSIEPFREFVAAQAEAAATAGETTALIQGQISTVAGLASAYSLGATSATDFASELPNLEVVLSATAAATQRQSAATMAHATALDQEVRALGERRVAAAEASAVTARGTREVATELRAVDPVADEMKRVSADATRVIASGFEDAVVRGRNLREVLQAIVDDLARIALRVAITKPFNNLVSGAFDAIGGSTRGGSGDFLSGAVNFVGSLFGFGGGSVGLPSLATGPGGLIVGGAADGAVFDRSRLMPFAAGGVVRRPTLFSLARGVGLMGEAGPEAILPLRRLPSGRLGVEAAGEGSRGVAINQTVNITVQGGGPGAPGGGLDPETINRLGATLRRETEAAVDRRVLELLRPGNALNPSF